MNIKVQKRLGNDGRIVPSVEKSQKNQQGGNEHNTRVSKSRRLVSNNKDVSKGRVNKTKTLSNARSLGSGRRIKAGLTNDKRWGQTSSSLDKQVPTNKERLVTPYQYKEEPLCHQEKSLLMIESNWLMKAKNKHWKTLKEWIEGSRKEIKSPHQITSTDASKSRS